MVLIFNGSMFGEINLKTLEIMAKKQVKYRDAGSGQYVKKDYAEKHPKTTVKETDKVKKK